jgi:hypothetical protein
MSEDHALMLEWFDRGGYGVNIPALATEFGLRLRTLADWAPKVNGS